MSSKTFITLTQSECLTVYPSLIMNADKHWDSATALAAVENYGAAASLSIISIEESTKGLVLCLDSTGFLFRKVKGMDTLFKNHNIRYFISYLAFAMSVFGDELMRFVRKARETPAELLALHQMMQTDKKSFDRKMAFYAARKCVLLRREFAWFSRVDVFRQDGLYTDYDDALKSPVKITKEDYEELRTKLAKVRRFYKELINSITEPDEALNKQLTELRRDFMRKGYYEKVANALMKVRQTKGNPFDLARKMLEGF